MTFRSRISGERRTTLPSEAVSGEWQTLLPISVNGTTATPGEVMLADLTGNFELVAGFQRGTWDWRLQMPEPVALGHLEKFAKQALALLGQPFSEWQVRSPLNATLKNELDLNALDREVQDHLRHLEYVSREPVARLDYTEQRLVVERAQRLSPRAVPHLAAHSEDWLHPTFQGVRPRHLLALVREDHLDLYENRVAARLMDHLHTYLLERLEAVSSVRVALLNTRKLQQQAEQGTYWRRQRLYTLWGKTTVASEEIERLEEVQQGLMLLLQRIEGCRHKLLYRSVPRTNVPRALRLTNIFANDKHYRFVALLWRAWANGTQATDQPEQNHARLQRIAATWDAFTLMLTARSLRHLGYVACDVSPLTPGVTTQLTHPSGDVLCLTWQTDGTHELHRNGDRLLKVVPLPSRLAERHLERMKAPGTLIVHLTPEREGARAELEPYLPRALHVQVNPLHLDSAEVYGRAISRAVLGSRLLAYPPLSPSLTTVVPPFAEQSKEGWVIKRLPSPTEEAGLDLVRQRERLVAILNQYEATGDSKSRSALQTARRDLDSFDDRVGAFQAAVALVRHLATCPICASQSADFEPREGPQFQARCSCGTQWGVRVCASGHPYAMLLPETAVELGTPEDAGDLFGMDLLALPKDSSGRRFICPDCGS